MNIVIVIKDKIVKQLYEYKRILSISKKPSKEEFLQVSKICAMGVGVVGLLGFLVQFIGLIV